MNWFKSKANEPQVEVECPNCGQIQSVNESISAVFCKNCKKTIYTKKSAKKGQEPSLPPREEPKTTPPASAEAAKEPPVQPREVPVHPAHKVEEHRPPPVQVPANEAISKPVSMVTPAHSSSMRKIKCSNCSAIQEVPSIALASFCEKCGQRINLQDYKIKGRFHGELETRGEIRIAAGAEVKANLNVGVAVIEGRIDGKVTAEYKVELNEGCLIVGTIASPVLIVHEGAGFVGKAIINPKPFDA